MLLCACSRILIASQWYLTLTEVVCHYVHVHIDFAVREASGIISLCDMLPDTTFAGIIGRERSPASDLYHDILRR